MASRAMMAAMGCGFLRRLSREAHAYADRRRIGPGPQSAIRFVRYRLAAIDTSYTICAALNDFLQTELDMKSDMLGAFPAVQAIKTVATERMLSAAHHYQQLVCGEGYRCGSPTNISAQAFLDARVYTIFDGTNDLLSQQLTEYCLARTDGLPLPVPGRVAAHRVRDHRAGPRPGLPRPRSPAGAPRPRGPRHRVRVRDRPGHAVGGRRLAPTPGGPGRRSSSSRPTSPVSPRSSGYCRPGCSASRTAPSRPRPGRGSRGPCRCPRPPRPRRDRRQPSRSSRRRISWTSSAARSLMRFSPG